MSKPTKPTKKRGTPRIESLRVENYRALHKVELDNLTPMTVLLGPKAPDFGDMKPIVRASFNYRGQHYKLDVTDPEYERACLEKGAGEYRIPSVVACISLSEPHTNQNGETFAYKLVASIITKERAGG